MQNVNSTIQVIKKDDTTEWFLNDEWHREDGPAVEHDDGKKEWWLSGKLHRVDGPAIEEQNGDKLWYMHGKLHRVDGPAIEDFDGYKGWFLNGKPYSNIDEYCTAAKIFGKNKTLFLLKWTN